MANDFFRTSIPSSVPKHYIANGNKKNQMLNALFLIYFSIVNGVETRGESHQGGPSAPGPQGRPRAGDGRRGCRPWPWRTSSGTLSAVSSSLKRLCSCTRLRKPAPPEDRLLPFGPRMRTSRPADGWSTPVPPAAARARLQGAAVRIRLASPSHPR